MSDFNCDGFNLHFRWRCSEQENDAFERKNIRATFSSRYKQQLKLSVEVYQTKVGLIISSVCSYGSWVTDKKTNKKKHAVLFLIFLFIKLIKFFNISSYLHFK